MPLTSEASLIQQNCIEQIILLIRGQKVILDSDLAHLYGVETKALLQSVRRNLDRFPPDFMFQLNNQELTCLRSQIVTSNRGRGGRRYLPYVFTEQGVAMLSSVLKSKTAVHVNIEIMRAFVRARKIVNSSKLLAEQFNRLEKKYRTHDNQIQAIFDAIRNLMTPRDSKKRKIGF